MRASAALALVAGLVAGALTLALSGSLGAAVAAMLGLAPVVWWALKRERELTGRDVDIGRLERTIRAQADELERARIGLERRTREADSLLEIALATGSTLNEKELLGQIARGAAQACRAQRSTVYLIDETGAWLTPAMSQFADGSTDPRIWDAFMGLDKIRLQSVPFLHEAAVTREPILVADAMTDCRVPRSWVGALGLCSLFAVPLLRRGRCVGLLVLDYPPDAGGTAAEHLGLGMALGEQVALAMQNAALYADAESRRREAEVMAEVVAAINASLDLDTAFRQIAEGAKELCNSQIAALALRDATGAMVLRYHTRAQTTGGDGEMDATGGVVYRSDSRHIGDEYGAVMRAEDLVAVLVVPIRSEQGVEGLLYVGNRVPRPFTARDKTILTQLADHAAIAIKNGRLFRAAQTRLAHMTRLTALSQLVASSLDYRQVLEFVTAAALDLLAGDTARLWVIDEESGRVRLAARGERGASDERDSATAEVPAGEGLVGWVISQRSKRYSPNLFRDSLMSSHERGMAAGYSSQIAVPLVLGDRAVGALVVLTRTTRTFGPEEAELLELFGSQAAAAIANARLYQTAQQAYDELARTQQQLTHAQKMEAVGRLAGGVAHDFNNLLTVIRGRAEQMLERLPSEHPLRRHAELIEKTGSRAAALTHQLLAFSRRQLLQPRVLDPNAVVADLEKMLRRVIGEDIDIELLLEARTGRIMADASQMEQVLMNLAVNARDAMPRGGTLTIRTANVDIEAGAGVPAGRYVVLEVHDSGIGMDEATRLRIFEPFFTTKEPGKGTGLGLATVYGIVQQSGGHIDVESAPGAGATFRIYLPRVERPVERGDPGEPAGGSRGGQETILLLEDEADVREMAAEALASLGYRVLETAKCVEALLAAERHDGPIHLFVTDVVMPQMSGPETAAQIFKRRPETRVLYISGYTDDALGTHGVLEAGVPFLPKPFTPADLGRKVREVLDEPATQPGGTAVDREPDDGR